MSIWLWLPLIAYIAGVALFLWVGIRETGYPWPLVVGISVLWLPSVIVAWIYRRLR